MITDHEAAWQALKAHLLTKSGHGTFGPEGLLARMTTLEVECAVEEGPTERIMRLFGIELSADIQQIVEQASGEPPIGGSASQQSPRRLHRSEDDPSHRNHRRSAA